LTNDTAILISNIFLTLGTVLCMYFNKLGRQVEVSDFRAFGWGIITAEADR